LTIPSIHFECLKLGLNQKKDGYVLTLLVQPDDLPVSLQRSRVGQRYMVAMAIISDDETPQDPDQGRAETAVKVAGILCRDPMFWKFLSQGDHRCADEAQAGERLRHLLSIDSRADLRHDVAARGRLDQIKSKFNFWKAENGK